ncbi:DNA replication complex GINS protein PSF3 isoform X8 [Chiloscyllium punctatum]|uniref:DNA replication complex GINS protein PSF3 isoform X8 n=1 Tax=Chiloscyllium punctatum TaxID=137246 RepID=UPI003B640209
MPRAESYLPVPPGGLEENFFSLDDILMTQEKVPCRTLMLLPRLGFLDKSSEADLIPETFVTRFRRIMDSSQNAYNEDTSSLVAHLDELERELFQAGQRGLNEFQKWEKGQAEQITTSNLVQSYGKRKFADMEA